jgi:hypothetical protein
MNRMLLPLLTLGLSLAPILCWAAEPRVDKAPGAAAESKPAASYNDATQLKALQQERVNVLTRLVEALEREDGKDGQSEFGEIASAESELCNALIDTTDDPEKRVALLTKQLDTVNDFLKVRQALFDSGAKGGTEIELYRAKSLVLCHS